MRIAALCGSSMGLPALAHLASQGSLVALGMPDPAHDAAADMQHLAAYTRLPLFAFTKEYYKKQLLQWLEESKPDVVFVITFPFKIPSTALAIPPLGFYNFHLALLPEYRGPNPIFWQIKNRLGKGGISVHVMDNGLDTGPLVWRQEIPIAPDETYGEHCAHLSQACVPVALQLAGQLAGNGSGLKAQAQNNSEARYWPRPQLADLIIDWNKMQVAEIQALVNASNPWNKGAYTTLNGNPIRITELWPSPEQAPPGTAAGTVVKASLHTGLEVACCDGTCLNVSVLFTGDAFMSGSRLTQAGVIPGMRFDSSPITDSAEAQSPKI